MNPRYRAEYSANLVRASEWNSEAIIPLLLQEVDGRRHIVRVETRRGAEHSYFPHVLDEQALVQQVALPTRD